MIETKLIQNGQYRRYGEYYRVWDIQTDEDAEAVKEYCFTNLYKRRVPHEIEWKKNVRFGGEKYGDCGYYFAGYYNLDKTENGYKFTICEPYDD